jgi:hypothetical protein
MRFYSSLCATFGILTLSDWFTNMRKNTPNTYRCSSVLIMLVWMICVPDLSYAAQMYGKVQVVFDGYEGTYSTVKRDIQVSLGAHKTDTEYDGFFRVENAQLQSAYESRLMRFSTPTNGIKVKLSGAYIKLPIQWYGWNTAEGAFLQPVTCIINSSGNAACRPENKNVDELRNLYGPRFGFGGPQFIESIQPEAAQKEGQVIEVVRPKPVAKPQSPPKPVGPTVIGPSSPPPKKPSAPWPEPDIIGPSD